MRVIHPKSNALAFLIASLALLLSCGEDGVVNQMPGGGGGGGGGGSSPPPDPGAAETSEAEAPSAEAAVESRGVRQLVFAEGARDPFMRPYPSQDDPTTPGSGTDFNIVNPVTPADEMGPLATYAIENLQLQGIMTRTANPVAMFRTPDGDLSEFAYIGDRIGPNGAGYIEDIQPNQIVVVYETDPGGPTRRTVVPLRDATGGIEAGFEQY